MQGQHVPPGAPRGLRKIEVLLVAGKAVQQQQRRMRLRAGWNVLTLHYRGSWGSPGKFSFGSAADDAHTALAWLRDAANDARYAIDPSRIAVAGHSMGGFTAASAAAADPAVAGLFLLDAWNPAATAKDLASPEGRALIDHVAEREGTYNTKK